MLPCRLSARAGVKQSGAALETGIAQMKEGLDLWAMTGFENWQALFATCLSDAYVRARLLDEAERLLDAHDARVDRFGEDQFKPPLALSRTCSARAGILMALPDLPRRRGSGRFETKRSYGYAHKGEADFLLVSPSLLLSGYVTSIGYSRDVAQRVEQCRAAFRLM